MMGADAPWFGALVLFETLIEGGSAGVEMPFEARIILVRAFEEADARERAEALGREAAHEYENEYGETVRCEFREVLDVVPLFDRTLGDGVELYYRFVSREAADIRRLQFR